MDMNEPIHINTGTSETHAEVVWQVETHRIVRRARNDKWSPCLFVLEAADGKDSMGVPRWRQLTQLDEKSTFDVLIRGVALLTHDLKNLLRESEELRKRING